MTHTRTLSFLAAGCLLAASCSASDDTSDPVTDGSESTDAPVETAAPVETDAPVETAAPVETEPPMTEAAPALPDGTQPIAVQPRGTDAFVSTQTFDETVATAVAAIEGNENLTLVATINHSANASEAGLELPPTTELIFGNPALGTPLMQLEPTVAIDLPQKMLIVEDLDGTVTVSWNRSDYLASRHGLPAPVEEQLLTINGALRALGAAAAATADDAVPTESVTVVGEREGLVEIEAASTARDAADRLVAAIEANANLGLVVEIDHAANAASVGLELSPIIEVIFGNPALGTPLMQASRTIGIDLPQKMLFIEDGETVRIIYNDPAYVVKRHRIDDEVPEVATIAAALDSLAMAAAG